MYSVATIAIVLCIVAHVVCLPSVLDEYIDKQTKCAGNKTPDKCELIIIFFQNY